MSHQWFVDSLRRGGPTYAWPVKVLSHDSGSFVYVEGLAGRFEGQRFSIATSKLYRQVPLSAKMARGVKGFARTKTNAEVVNTRIVKALNNPATDKVIRQFQKNLSDLEAEWRPQNPSDLAWKYFDEEGEKAARSYERFVDYKRPEDAHYTLGAMLRATNMVLGSIERTPR